MQRGAVFSILDKSKYLFKMKNLYKALFLPLVIAGLYSCSKSNVEPTPEPPVTGAITNTTVFYADTFRIYSTAFGGASRKLVVDEDIKSGNNYIITMSAIPGKSIMAYAYTTGYLTAPVIKTVKFDGTDKKSIKTLPVGCRVNFLKGIIDGKLYYGISYNEGTLTVTKNFVINADGTGEKELTGLPNLNFTPNNQISSQGLGILTSTGYYAKITNGTFDELNSFNAWTNETSADIQRMAISDDGTKLALLYKTSAANKFEIRIKDLSKTAAKATTVYTVTLDAETSQFKYDMLWSNGAKNIIFYNGKFTMPSGATADYTKCEYIDVEKGTATNWKFTGDEIGKIVVD